MIIFGGCGLKGLKAEDTLLNDLWDLNLDTLNWSCHSNSGICPSPREFHSSVILNDKMYVIGGNTISFFFFFCLFDLLI